MNFWEKVKKDVQKGIKEGIGIVREGVTVVREKAGVLTEEGKKRLKIFDLKAKVHRDMSELGGLVYDLSSKMQNPMLHKKVKAIVARLKRSEARIEKLEGKQKRLPKKAKPKRVSRSKKK